jgi:hypothetical protein
MKPSQDELNHQLLREIANLHPSHNVEGSSQRIKNLVEQGADVNLITPNGTSFADAVLFAKDHDLLRFIISRPEFDFRLSGHGSNILHYAILNYASEGSIESGLSVSVILQSIRNRGPEEFSRIINMNSSSDGFGSALHSSAVRGCGIVPSALLTLAGANLEERNPRIGITPLEIALAAKNFEVSQIIGGAIEAKKNPQDLRYASGITMSLLNLKMQKLSPELKQTSHEILQDTLNYVVDGLKKLAEGNPLVRDHILQSWLSIMSQEMESALLVKASENPEKSFFYSEQELGLALHCVRLGSNINMRAPQGANLLQLAAYFKAYDICDELIRNGADAEASTTIKFVKINQKKGRAEEKEAELTAKKLWLLPRFLGDAHVALGNPVPDFFPETKKKPDNKEVVIAIDPIAERWQAGLSILQNIAIKSTIPEIRVITNSSEEETRIKTINAYNAALEEIDVNLAASKGWTALHIAARFGNVELLNILLQRSANIRAIAKGKNNEDLSVLNCAIQNGNEDAIKILLNFEDRGFGEITSDIKSAIESRDQALKKTSLILRHSSIIHKAAQLSGSERNVFINALRKSIKPTQTQLRVEFNEFEKAVISEVNLIKNSAKKTRPIIEEEVAPVLSRKEREALEKTKRLEKELKERQEKEERLTAQKLRQEVLLEEVANIAQEARQEALLQRQEDRKQELTEFLSNYCEITSTANLPPLLQRFVNELLEKNSVVMIKGSAVYQRDRSNRVPSDLDLEIWVDGIGSSDELAAEIKDVIDRHLDLAIDPSEAYRGSEKKSTFSLNVKDQSHKLDISIYDSKTPPLDNLSWLTSKDKKILFDKDGIARDVKPRGLQDFLDKKSDQTLPDFFINPEARSLILRLCFLQTVGEITREEIEMALPQLALPRSKINRSPYLPAHLDPEELVLINPATMLIQSLRITREEVLRNEKDAIKEVILDFVKSHFESVNQQAQFIQNLVQITNWHHQELSEIPLRELFENKTLFEVLDEISANFADLVVPPPAPPKSISPISENKKTSFLQGEKEVLETIR